MIEVQRLNGTQAQDQEGGLVTKEGGPKISRDLTFFNLIRTYDRVAWTGMTKGGPRAKAGELAVS